MAKLTFSGPTREADAEAARAAAVLAGDPAHVHVIPTEQIIRVYTGADVVTFDPGKESVALTATISDGGIGFLSLPSGPAQIPMSIGNAHAARRLTGHSGTAAANRGRTWETQFLFPVDVIAIQLVFHNWQTNDFTSMKSSVMARTSQSAASGSLIPVTVGGAASFTIKGLTSGGSGTTPQEVVAHTVSDIIPIESVARSDGGRGAIIAVRTFFDAANANELTVSKYSATIQLDTSFAGQFWVAGDMTAAGNESASLTATYQGAPVSIIAYTRKRVITILAVGDSIINGSGNDVATVESGVDIAVRNLQREGAALDVVNMGHVTQASPAFYVNGVNGLDLYRPSIAFFAVGSPNDTGKYTGQWFAETIVRAVQWIAECRKRGIVPGLLTMPPAESLTSAYETQRRRLVAATLDMASAHGIPVIDRSAIWTNTASATGGYISGYGYDTLHPSKAGYAVEAVAWEKALRALML